MTDKIIAICLALALFLVLMLTASDYGLTYDEPWYMSLAQKSNEWLGTLLVAPGYAISREGVDRFWKAKDYQPGFVKLVGGVAVQPAALVFHPLAALRAGTALLCAILAGCLYLWVGSVWGRVAGLYGVGALFLMPRVFAHSHLLALDAPIMVMSTLTVACCWMVARTGKWSWAIASGILWGLALNTKLNAFFIPFAVFPWLLMVRRKTVLPVLGSFVILGPLVFLLTWPLMWHDTVPRFLEYFNFHLHHGNIGVTYFGTRYDVAPCHYPFWMTEITMPLATYLLFMVGLFRTVGYLFRMAFSKEKTTAQEVERTEASGTAKDRNCAPGPDPFVFANWGEALLWLAGFGLCANIIPSCLPDTPKYGGVRLFLPAFPFIAILATSGFVWIANPLRRWAERRLSVHISSAGKKLAVLLLVAALIGPLMATVASHPYQMSYYSAMIGGLSGATERGMEPTYWGDTYLAAFVWLYDNARPNSVIWIEPPGLEGTFRTTYGPLGILRPDLRLASGEGNIRKADYAVTQNKPTEFTDITRKLVREHQPAFTEELDGVPLIFVFDLNGVFKDEEDASARTSESANTGL